MRLIDEVR